MIAARRCHSKYHQAEESGVMESPQTRISLSSSRRTVSESCARSGVRYPRSKTTERPGSILHRPPLFGLAAERCAFKVLSARFLCLCARTPRLIEPCPQWSELTWERITDTLTLRSAAWRRVRSTRSEEPATSFAFLQPLPSMGFQPITANERGSGVGRTPFKVAL